MGEISKPGLAILAAAFAAATLCARAAEPDIVGGGDPPPPPRAEMGGDGRSVVYDGEVVMLSRAYQTFEDYEADPDNIAPSEAPHVERLMRNATLPSRFSDRAAAFSAVTGLAFPGYGTWGLETGGAPDHRDWAVVAVEIPRSGKSRYVAISSSGHEWKVIDDFVAADSLGLRFAARTAGGLAYSDRQHRLVFTHPDQDSPAI